MGMVQRARASAGRKGRTPPWAARGMVLAQVAEVLEERRGEAIAAEAHVMGKTVRESDPEISEGIDFVQYAAHLTLAHEKYEKQGLAWQPHQVTVVAGPWNFPYAIPLSELVHAIAAGGAAILKPAPEAREVGALLVDSLHRAGVPEDLVQLACTPDNEVGQRLITHEGVKLVMLTGSLETADLFTSWKPDIRMNAETSGKNAMVITAAADIDQAIKDLVKSAFGHAGQKCSAASLAIIEASVYDDPSFHVRLADAVRSLRVGPATDLATIMGPLIAPARGPLERALTTHEPGESWLVEPKQRDETT
jgi:NAD-dependent aldehyde dehydrogenases